MGISSVRNPIVLLLLVLSPRAHADQALVRARTGNASFYARSYSVESALIKFRECIGDKPRSVKNSEYVVLESENICARVNFDDQLLVIKNGMAVANKLGTEIKSIKIYVPDLNGQKQYAIDEIRKGSTVPTQILKGGEFKIQLASDNTDRAAISAQAVEISESLGNDSPKQFLEVVRYPKLENKP
jgi:hypothetical protein